MEFRLKEVYNNFKAHLYINSTIISSQNYAIFTIDSEGKIYLACELPIELYKRLLCKNRIVRRLMRLGITNIYPIFEDKLLICCSGKMFLSDLAFLDIRRIEIPFSFHQLLDHSICITSNRIYYGEYIPNPARREVKIFTSKDGAYWEPIYTFPKGSIKHIHTLQYDEFTNRVWFSTGDANNECILGFADLDFSDIVIIGKDSQKWRTLEFCFNEESVFWGMDTSLVQSKLIHYNRSDGEVSELASFGGPIWNLKQIKEKGFLIGTAVERGTFEWDDRAHLWFSQDMRTWKDKISYEKDVFPCELFGHGRFVIADRVNDKLILSGHALSGADSKLLVYSLKDKD